MNYIILAANAIVSISSAIVLGIFIHGFKYQGSDSIQTLYHNLTWTVAIPFVAFFIGCGLIGVYVWQLKKFLKENTTPINPKLLDGHKYAWGCSIINFIAPLALSVTAIFTYDQNATQIMLWVGFGVSAAFSLAIIGFTTYLNVGITFSNLSREELKRIAEEENQAFAKSKETHDDTPIERDSDNKDKSKPTKEEASAGGF